MRSEKVYEYFGLINEKFWTTFIILTHYRKIAEQIDRIVEMKDGRIHTDIRR